MHVCNTGGQGRWHAGRLACRWISDTHTGTVSACQSFVLCQDWACLLLSQIAISSPDVAVAIASMEGLVPTLVGVITVPQSCEPAMVSMHLMCLRAESCIYHPFPHCVCAVCRAARQWYTLCVKSVHNIDVNSCSWDLLRSCFPLPVLVQGG